MEPTPLRRVALRALPWSLALWLVGMQVQEGPATAGAYATGALALGCSWPLRPGRRWWPLLAFVAWCALAPTIGGALPSPTGLARLADFLLIPAAAVAVRLVEPKALERVALAGALALLASVAVAAFQYFGVWPDREALSWLGWTGAGLERVYEPVPGRTDRFMAGGFLFHRLKFANVSTVVCMLGAAGVALGAPRRSFLLFITTVGLVGLLVFPQARAASVVAVLAAAVAWVAAAHRRVLAALGAVSVILAAGLTVGASPSLRARFLTAHTAEGSGHRSALTTAGLNAIIESPAFGVGLGRFRPGAYLPQNAPTQAREHRGRAHNQFLTVGAEAGVPAVALLVVTLVAWLHRGLRQLPQGAAAVASVAVFVGLSLLHDPLFHAESSLAIMLGLGAGVGWMERQAPEA